MCGRTVGKTLVRIVALGVTSMVKSTTLYGYVMLVSLYTNFNTYVTLELRRLWKKITMDLQHQIPHVEYA